MTAAAVVMGAEMVLAIARVAHEANRAYCVTLGDYTQPPWETVPEWQRDSAVSGVTGILDGRIQSPEQSHEAWCKDKRRDGWGYGVTKDPERKLHPCLVPYHDLPEEQRRKDRLFFAVVNALKR